MAEAVLRVFEGEVYYSQSLGTILQSLVTDEEHGRELYSLDSKELGSLLTPRELEIIELVAKGLQNKEIAVGLGIKRRTADFHIGNILSKLGASSRLEAVIMWKGFK